MNISQPLWGRLVPSAANYSINGSTGVAEINSTGFSDDQTNAIINTISSSGTYTWSFEMHWTVALPATFITLLLPLVAGPIFRFALKQSYHYRNFARVILIFALIAGLTTADEYLYNNVFLCVFGVGCGVPILVIFCYASYRGKDQWLWSTFSIVFAASFLIEWFLDPVTILVSWAPFVYLLAFWGIDELRTTSGTTVQKLKARLNHWRNALGNHWIPREKRWIWQLALVLLYYGIAGAIWWNLLGFVASIILGIPFCVLAYNRFFRGIAVGKNRSFWAGFFFLSFVFSILGGIESFFSFFSAFLCFLPMTYLFSVWLSEDYRDLWHRLDERRRGRRRARANAVSSPSNESVEMRDV